MKKIRFSMKGLIAGMLTLGSIGVLQATDLQCDQERCKTREKVSFMGYQLYAINYEITNTEERIKLVYDINVAREKNIKKILEKFEENNAVAKADKEKLNIWVNKTIDAQKGSSYEVVTSKTGSILNINNKKVLAFDDAGDFAKKFLKIWSGDKPVDENLKDKISEARKKFNS